MSSCSILFSISARKTSPLGVSPIALMRRSVGFSCRSIYEPATRRSTIAVIFEGSQAKVLKLNSWVPAYLVRGGKANRAA